MNSENTKSPKQTLTVLVDLDMRLHVVWGDIIIPPQEEGRCRPTFQKDTDVPATYFKAKGELEAKGERGYSPTGI